MAEFGYVTLSRKGFARDPLWLQRRVFSRWEAWVDCIQMAAWQRVKRATPGGVEIIERGEFVASLRFLAQRWRWGLQMVRTFLKLTQQDGRISTQRETALGTVYLLVNYDRYQRQIKLADDNDNTPSPPTTNTELTQSQHTSNTEPTQIEDNKGNKGSKRKKTVSVWTPDEQAVVEHYRQTHPKRLRGDVPETLHGLIRNALKGYSLPELCQAIDRNAASQFHREGNHMGLDLILRDSSKIDYFIGLTPHQNGNGHQSTEDVYDLVARRFQAEESHAS